MEGARSAAGRFEEALDTASFYVKPYLPVTARFLLVVTFLEDSLRIM
jgi:hypothetical protein